jgi:hypothetical protein
LTLSCRGRFRPKRPLASGRAAARRVVPGPHRLRRLQRSADEAHTVSSLTSIRTSQEGVGEHAARLLLQLLESSRTSSFRVCCFHTKPVDTPKLVLNSKGEKQELHHPHRPKTCVRGGSILGAKACSLLGTNQTIDTAPHICPPLKPSRPAHFLSARSCSHNTRDQR